MTTQIFIWWLIIEALGLLALPLTMFLFRALPDRGYAWSKALGLLLPSYAAWLLAMLGLAPFGAGLLVGCALLVGVLGVLTLKPTNDQRPTTNDTPGSFPGVPVLGLRFSVFGTFFRANWRTILCYEMLFVVMLVFMALVRSYNPQPWGTERPMDYAFFNAIRRSDAFPPHDPWLAGYSINYYYFGYLLMAAMALLSNLEPSVGFNLSMALIFALTALGVAGIVRNLIALTTNDQRPTTNSARSPAHPLTHSLGIWLAVLSSVVLVLFAANQGGALQIISGTERILEFSGTDMARALANGVQRRDPLYLDAPYKAWGDTEDVRIIEPTNKWQDFNWWNPSRALWDKSRDPNDNTKYYAITEFPFFSFWLGDMHPHVMSLPFSLLALALALQTLARPAAPPFAQSRRGWLELALTGIVLGSLYTINSWDFPTYLLLFLGALLLLYVRLSTPRSQDSATDAAPLHLLRQVLWPLYLQQVMLVVVAALAMFAPFYLTFHSLVGGKEPLINLPIIGGLSRTLGIVTWDKTTLHTFLIIFGLFLVPLVAYIAGQTRQARVPRWLLWATLGALIVGVLIHFPLLVLLPLALTAITAALNRATHPATTFAVWAFALVCLICFGTELIYIRDTFEGAAARMNTIFKFYYQAWLIWGTLSGYALWWVFSRGRGLEVRSQEPGARSQGSGVRSQEFGVWSLEAAEPSVENSAGTVAGEPPSVVGRRSSVVGRLVSISVAAIFGVLLFGGLIYPWMTAGRAFRTGTRVGLMGQTPRQNTSAGAAAISWLRANTSGGDVILEAVGGAYNGEGSGGVAASTGLTNIINWPSHEGQWRGGDPKTSALLGPRENDVNTLFNTTDVDQARALLDQYKVKYVYIGAVERAKYPAEGLAKFAQLAQPGAPAFQQDEVVIYKIG